VAITRSIYGAGVTTDSAKTLTDSGPQSTCITRQTHNLTRWCGCMCLEAQVHPYWRKGLDDVSCFLLRLLFVIVSFFRVFDVICNFVDDD
jgi:hypothetical protein